MAGRLVRLAQSASAHFAKPVVTRHYAWALLGRFDVELELLPSSRTIKVKIHALNATGILQQVTGMQHACNLVPVGNSVCLG